MTTGNFIQDVKQIIGADGEMVSRLKSSLWLPVLVLLLAAALRFHALGQAARFHPDEALFATFARNAAVNGDWLLSGPLDKPPLSIYISAFSMMLIGVAPLPNGVLTLDVHAGEFAARLPNVFAGILLVAVLFAITRRLYGLHTRIALLAAFLLAGSPFALAFSATAFTDGLMLLFVALSLWRMSARRWFSSGFWLALGFACKPQALLVVPLLLLIGWVVTERSCLAVSLWRWLLPLLLSLALLLAWDAARGQPVSLWTLAAAHNDPRRLIRADEMGPRLRAWLAYLGWFAGFPVATALLSLTGITALARRVRQQPRERAVLIDLLLVTYLVGYLLLHWLLAFDTYDRYLLLVLPVVILLIARGLDWAGERWIGSGWFRQLALILLVFMSVCASIVGSVGSKPFGGDQGRHTGIDALAAYLNEKPVGTIIYDHWLGWELGYYLGAWSDKRRVYYPTPAALVADALLQPDPAPRYLPVPADVVVRPWLEALTAAGFAPTLTYRNARFVVYELIPP